MGVTGHCLGLLFLPELKVPLDCPFNCKGTQVKHSAHQRHISLDTDRQTKLDPPSKMSEYKRPTRSRSNETMKATSKQKAWGKEYQKREMAINILRRRGTMTTTEAETQRQDVWAKRVDSYVSVVPGHCSISLCGLLGRLLRWLFLLPILYILMNSGTSPLQCSKNVTAAHSIWIFWGLLQSVNQIPSNVHKVK